MSNKSIGKWNNKTEIHFSEKAKKFENFSEKSVFSSSDMSEFSSRA